MALSVVNGFLCFCSCDVEKAKSGKDPHPSTDPTKAHADKKHAISNPARADQPAVIFGGSLSGTASAGSANPVAGTQPAAPLALLSREFTVEVLA